MLVIADPLADKKTELRIKKLLIKGKKNKSVKRGIKATLKELKRGSYGLLIIGGDVSPMDLVIHLPALCEKRNLPYVFVESKSALSVASEKGTSSVCCFIPIDKDDLGKTMSKVLKTIKYST
ncbi:H/ACA ribonucleoprotein complex subunit NHP2 [Astathelohania contejeani]|uniref:H/ACA ribonucleoprotein complex subunit NHP2 n=1 Tax=Astathelohania contejeani TaxID=164912 RepID=A0ABQ7HZ87_9MICR|nr:H/ACA ribonucleoprotein complex subunit NHP2 [Thelohania contejeani]